MITQHIDALNNGDLQQRLQAVETLGVSNNPKAVGPLVRALHKAPDVLREAICEALGVLGDLRATSPLLSHLRDDSEDVRAAAFTSLFMIGEKRASAMPDASAWESNFANPNEALTQIAWQTDLEAVKILYEALKDPDPEVKIGASYTLGQLGILSALEPISQLLYYDPDEEVQAAAAFALGAFGALGQRTLILQALSWAWQNSAGKLELQNGVLRALSDLEDPQSIPIFLSALQHPDAVIRQLAVIGVGRLKAQDGLSTLCTLLRDPDVGVRRNAAYALGHLNATEAIYSLIYATSAQSSEVRNAIAYTLKKLPRDQVQESIRYCINAEDEEIRIAAAYLLGHIEDEAGLKMALQDNSPKVRKSAALSVGNAKVLTLRTTLHTVLQDVDWSVRVGALEGLKRLGDPASLKAIAPLRSDSHPVVQSAAEAAWKGLGGV